ncbi:MAG: DUF2961 domain-containing protein [Planctomycetes bacterium]|nr:DUF2961 domain-containing protein [Planctomycetota bacterium]
MNLEQQPLYRHVEGCEFLCSNVHNPSGQRGVAGQESRFPRVAPGETLTVAELEGPAVITRFWLTFDWPGKAPYPKSMQRNRSVVLKITWDDADTPAIQVPVGDFFCHPLGYDIPFENALFASPVGRSLLCFIPMPFQRRARIQILNEFNQTIVVFHDIRYAHGVDLVDDDGYLHACFQRTPATAPGIEHEILPQIHGRGRYLGTHIGVITDPENPLVWHGAHPRFFLDGDTEDPSMIGASLDDFGGASWEYDRCYMHQDSGLLLSRSFPEGGGHYGFYFYHRRDPIYFEQYCAVSIRPVVAESAETLLQALRNHPGLEDRLSLPLAVEELAEQVAAGSDEWHECGRRDEYATVSLYYLDEPGGNHTLSPVADRMAAAWHWPSGPSLLAT